MADEAEETEDDSTSGTVIVDMKDRQSLTRSRIEVSSAKIFEPQTPVEPNVTFEEAPKDNVTMEDNILLQVADGGDEKSSNIGDKKSVTPNIPSQPRSACRARSRDTRQCQKHFREIIGKHETRNDELEQLEGDLRQRMDMLECSMPAVMTWNVWRMAQNAPASTVRRLLEKQFKDHGGSSVSVPSTPSQHYDCRVREIEAERKEALRRAEEARVLLAEKEAAVEERRRLLEDAKKCNQERREKMEKLSREAAELRSALKNARGDDNSCETGECGEIRCRDKWLDNVGSVSSIGSTDLECFAKLQELAEAEICMKRQISELERREEAYMRTLQQADDLWLKMEGDTADTVSELKDQLDSKTAANQQLADRICSLEDELEKSKMRLIGCKDALLKFTDKKFSDVEIGFDDGEATVTDRGIVAAVRTAGASTIAAPTTTDQETLVFPETTDEESSVVPEAADAGLTASTKMFDKDTEVIVDLIDRGVDRPTGLGIDAGVGDDEASVVKAEGLRNKTDALRNLKRRGSKAIDLDDDEDDKDIPEHWKNWDWDEGCPPDAICDDMVESSTGTDDLQPPKGVPTTESKVQATPEVVDQPVGGRGTEDLAEIDPEVVLRLTDAPQQATDIPTITDVPEVTKGTDGTVLETHQIVLSPEELRNWYNIVDSVHHVISKCVNCSSKMDDTAQLAERMKLHLRIKGLSGVKEPTVLMESVRPIASIDPSESVDDAESPVLDGVRKIDDIVDSLSVEVEKLTSVVVSETLMIPEDGISPELTVDSMRTAETVAMPVDSGTMPDIDEQKDILATSPEKSEQRTDISKKRFVEEIMPSASQQEFLQTKEATQPIVDDRKTFSEPESVAPAIHEGIVMETKIQAKLTDIPRDETSAAPRNSSEELPKARSSLYELHAEFTQPFPESESVAPKIPEDIVGETEVKAKFTEIPIDETSTASVKLSAKLATAPSVPRELQVEYGDSKEPSERLQVSEESEMEQSVVVPEMPVDDESFKSEVDTTKEARVEDTAVSFVTPRTPPPSRMDVQFHQKSEDVLNEIEQTSESVVESLIKFEELESANESPQPETPERPTAKTDETPESGIGRVTSEVQSLPDEITLKLLDDKVPDKISGEERIAMVPEPSVMEKPYSSIPKEESAGKVKLPMALDQCICQPRTCPLLHRTVSPDSKLKAPKLFTEGTQASTRIPKGLLGNLDKLKFKTITESTWPSSEVGIWRRPIVWSRRPRDKSTLTTPCVDTQTDSALVRERITLGGIDRKNRTTCSGVCPIYTEYAGCSQRISSQPPAPVGLAVAELFDGSVRFPATMASSAEKEITVVKYDDRSLMPREGELHCVECGRPITPDGTPLSEKPSPSTSSKSQKSIMASLKKNSSSTSHMSRKKDPFTCCDCKTSDHRKMKENDGSWMRRKVENISEKRTSDSEVCCPCPADVIQTMSAKSSKPSKKKRKPEKKDQSVTANIPRSKIKPLSKEPKKGDTPSVAKTEDSKTCVTSKMHSQMISSSSPIKTPLKANKPSTCTCDEDSTAHTSVTKHSSMSKDKVARVESSCNSATEKSSMNGNMPSNCSSAESVSREGSCNCAPLNP